MIRGKRVVKRKLKENRTENIARLTAIVAHRAVRIDPGKLTDFLTSFISTIILRYYVMGSYCTYRFSDDSSKVVVYIGYFKKLETGEVFY